MPNSNSRDGMGNVSDEDKDGVKGGEDPIDRPPVQPEEPVDGGGDADGLTVVYQGNVYSVSPDKVQVALSILRDIVTPDMLSMFGNIVPAGNPDVGSDPVNQQGTDGLPVLEKRKESFPQDAALGMQLKKGKFVDDGEGSSSGLARSLDSDQDDGLLETSCKQCGISSKSTMMLSGPDGPETLCNACGLLWDSKSNEEAKDSDASKNVSGK